MAVASVSIPGSTPGPTLGFDDYSLYSNLSDDELIQLAIERSLSDAHNAASRGEASNTPTALGRRTVQHRANPPPTRPNPPNPPRQEPSHRPPTANPTDAQWKAHAGIAQRRWLHSVRAGDRGDTNLLGKICLKGNSTTFHFSR
ncbi:hypothetical protein J4Q44_G00321490 [Coregonus suidteri]|uniref:Uncharacterized protein n=1 Tax=Coregonus suidteri TaxID=861788 RepID=A0AAN8L2Q9_9TELE